MTTRVTPEDVAWGAVGTVAGTLWGQLLFPSPKLLRLHLREKTRFALVNVTEMKLQIVTSFGAGSSATWAFPGGDPLVMSAEEPVTFSVHTPFASGVVSVDIHPFSARGSALLWVSQSQC